MIQKKICILGAFAVGKTSLVARYVNGLFSAKYITTVGVKIDCYTTKIQNQDINMILWDIAGEDEFLQIKMSYVRGSSGYLLVVDGTRRATLDKAINLNQRVLNEYGKIPFILLINKFDLKHEWEIDQTAIDNLRAQGWPVIFTSAKEGVGVEEAFNSLAAKVLIS